MNSVATRLVKLENAIIAVCFIVMTIAAFAQVVNRNLIGAGISWFDELARYCMVYMTLLATEAGLRDGSQINITAVIDKLNPLNKRIMQVVVKIVIIGFSATIFWTSLTIIKKQILSGQVSAGLNLPMWLPYLSLPIVFCLITIVQLYCLGILIKSPLPAKEEKKTAKEEKK